MAIATTEEAEATPDPEQQLQQDEERKANADISAVARGGLLNLVGAAGTGIFTFALVTVLTRGLGPASYGAFVSAMGLFTVLSNTAELVADTGLVRTIARLRALDRVRDIRKTILVAVIPPLLIGSLFGVAMWLWAPQLAHIFGKGKGSDQIAEFARWMAPFPPAGGWPASSRSSCCGSTRCWSGGWPTRPRPASSTPPPATSPPGSWSAWPSSTWPGRSCRS